MCQCFLCCWMYNLSLSFSKKRVTMYEMWTQSILDFHIGHTILSDQRKFLLVEPQ